MKNIIFSILSLITLLISSTTKGQATYSLAGDAYKVQDDWFRLTQNTTNQAGAVWYPIEIDLRKDFELYFEMNFGTNSSGADGMAFVLQPKSSSIVVKGGGIGYKGVSPSILCQFDTYQNYDSDFDPGYDHMSILKNGSVSHSTYYEDQLKDIYTNWRYIQMDDGNIKDGKWYNCHVTWKNKGATQKFKIVFNCKDSLVYEGNIITDIFKNDPMTYFGFTAATGEATNEHQVRFNYISFYEDLKNITTCTNTPKQIINNMPGKSYSWTPTDYLDNPAIASPTVNIPTSGNYKYTVDIIDFCSEKISKTVNINVFENTPHIIADQEICDADNNGTEQFTINLLDFLPSGNYTFKWPNNSTASTYTTNITPPYKDIFVEITPEGACTGIDTFRVTLKTPIKHPKETPSFCPNDSVEIGPDMAASNAQYSWSTGETTQKIFAKAQIQYTLQINYPDSTCPEYYYYEPIVSNNIQVLIDDKQICRGTTIELTGSDYTTANNYTWVHNGNQQTGAKYTISEPGTYTLIGNTGGCNGQDDFTVSYYPTNAPTINGTIPEYICPNDAFPIQLEQTGSQITWLRNDTIITTTSNILNTIINKKGTYKYQITTSNGCLIDSTFKKIQNKESFNFDIKDTSMCEGQTITIQAPHSPIPVNYQWSNGTTNNNISVSTSGTYTLTISHNMLCSTTDTFKVITNPMPTAEIVLNNFTGCIPLTAHFSTTESPNPNFKYTWDFGDNTTSNELETTHLYIQEGSYPIKLNIISDKNCETTISAEQPVIVSSNPKADFEYSQTNNELIANFNDLSVGAEIYFWDFGDSTTLKDTSSINNPSYTYDSASTYAVTLWAISKGGCKDSITKEITLIEPFALWKPTAFSPDGDGENDTFKFTMTEVNNYRLSIFTRWGQLIYTSENQHEGWDGKIQKTNIPATPDVYVWLLEFEKKSDHKKYVEKGTVMLVK